MKNKTKIAVVGIGLMGSQHLIAIKNSKKAVLHSIVDINEKSRVHAKKFKVPFRSNLKIFDKHLIAANQNNDLFIFNRFNGNVLKQIPTEETSVKNEFIK